ncbi:MULTISPECIES: hypothetical protein [Pacificibacter]|uniref:hypothetical protein n=1 Tax=Pacificibacter TaxID=1042323 RepID=UPI001C096BF3|nr:MULTISPECIES: hypothetical protein [Pacificibacter]MBU2937655.1 hypothetical protein [Pacificibacter marinus]MDO6616148.1 hypothetical protein [Pacificibacter sp. 1_MG-2023]
MFQSKASIAGIAIAVVVGIILVAMQISISTSVMSTVSGEVSGVSGTGSSYYHGRSDGDVLDPTRIIAPKGGNGKLAELEIIDDGIPSAEVIIDDGTGNVDFEAKVIEEPDYVLSEDAGVVEKVVFFAGVVWRWILGDRGEKEDSYEMSCKPKKGGGKVCTIIR